MLIVPKIGKTQGVSLLIEDKIFKKLADERLSYKDIVDILIGANQIVRLNLGKVVYSNGQQIGLESSLGILVTETNGGKII
jgi:hypothetical protein